MNFEKKHGKPERTVIYDGGNDQQEFWTRWLLELEDSVTDFLPGNYGRREKKASYRLLPH